MGAVVYILASSEDGITRRDYYCARVWTVPRRNYQNIELLDDRKSILYQEKTNLLD